MLQNFKMNGGGNYEWKVIHQANRKYDAMSIQISKVCIGLAMDCRKKVRETGDFRFWVDNSLDDLALVYRWVYEEVSNDDMVIYASFYEFENIKKIYPWALERLDGRK